MALFHALRLPNLIVVICCLFGARVILCGDRYNCISDSALSLLCAQTVLILIGGNLINDYFDRRIDLVNKPQRVWVGTRVPAWVVLAVYVLVNLMAVCLCVYADFGAFGQRLLTFYFPVTIIGLLLYSAYFKCFPLVGNLMIACFCALVPLQAMELDAYTQQALFSAKGYPSTLLNRWGFFKSAGADTRILTYVTFAFVLTLWRELIKDLQDLKGDNAHHCKTLPVAIGENTARYCAVALGVLVFGLLATIVYQDIPAERQPYFFAFFLAPCGIAIYWLLHSGHPIFYQRASLMVKALMLIGIFGLAISYQ